MSEALRRELEDPGYTPARRVFGELLPLLAEPDFAQRAERALRSAGLPAALFAAEALTASDPALGPALVRLAGHALRSNDSPALLQALELALRSRDPETRRQAAIALGKCGRAACEDALLDCLTTPDAKLLRSVVEALGKVGGERALARLRTLTPPDKLRPILERACLMLERTTERAAGAAGTIALDVALPEPRSVVLSCRAGLVELLAQEARPLGGRAVSDSEVALDWGGTLRPLLSLRIALDVGLSCSLDAATPAAVLSGLLRPELVGALRAWTLGALRFRLDWVGHGHRRADTW
ncbi:MAG TPA: HEAT repeat domain-containing protein, partial [Myxococcota bacterium]|nr:HEAT repeat domain-containing protein [Myxococcota bacterium]